MELTEKEAHCIARLIQGGLFGKNVLKGCQFCKYKCKTEKDPAPHLDEIRMKLTDATGVDLGYDGSSPLGWDDFPYRKFLRNSNDEIKERINKYFKHCEGFQVP